MTRPRSQAHTTKGGPPQHVVGPQPPDPPEQPQDGFGAVAVAADIELHGCSMDTYTMLLACLELTSSGRALPSCLFLWVEDSADGVVLHEVWADRAVWDQVLIEFLLPATSILGLPLPTVRTRAVAGYLIGEGDPIRHHAPRRWFREDAPS